MEKQLFDSGWEFTDQPIHFIAPMAAWQPVDLPHDVAITKARSKEAPTRGSGGYAWSGVVTYRKKFQVPEEWKAQSVQLEFEGVYMNAEVTLNGNLLSLHPYGYTSFLVDLTHFLVFGAENELVVVVNNSAQPNSRWYTGTGIYRHVWLRLGNGCYIQPWGVFVTTPVVDQASSTVAVATEVLRSAGVEGAITLRTTLVDDQGGTVAQRETPLVLPSDVAETVHQELQVTHPRLWSVAEPNLYTLISEVLLDGRIIDHEKTAFGIRSIAVDSRQGFRLNGVPMKLKGGCVHHDNGLLGAASYDRAEDRKIELMKSAGFTAIRCAHNPPAPAMLDACDRLGMLVIDETFDCWRMGKNPNDYHLTFEDWWQRDSEAMVKRDRNHPSVIMWSIGNEVSERTGVSQGYAWSQKQADFIRSLDSTRLVTSAVPFLFEGIQPDPEKSMEELFEQMLIANPDPEKDRWGLLTREFMQPLDVAGYNYLYKRYQTDGERFPERVICGTETWPHEAFEFWNATQKLPHVIGDFVWTSLDYLGESGIGKVSFDVPQSFLNQEVWPYHLANCGDFDICGFKRPQSYYRDLLWGIRKEPYLAVLDPQLFEKKITFNQWGWEPVAHCWTFPGQDGKPTRVDVYSIDDEVELWVNGASMGRQPAGAARQNKAVFEVTYQPGTLEVMGYTNGQATAKVSLQTSGAPAALRLTPDRAEIRHTFGDLSYVTVEVVDQEGRLVPYADHEIVLELSGSGQLIAIGTANPLSEELYVGNQRKAFEGRLMAVVRSTGDVGEIHLKARADGLSAAEAVIQAK